RILRCRTVATTQLRQRHHIRDLAPMGSGAAQNADATLLSEDEEPHPSEMLLAALGACLTVGIQANAVARGIPLKQLEVHSQGDVDPSALWGTGPRRARPLGFQSIAIEIHIEADVPREVLKALVDYAVLWSPVANTLHDPVDLVVSLVDRQDES
ncbi:MAG: OsmC family protein, partial [Janthinobacterium lividum]